ncbi:hypothetical protein ACMSD2_25420 [Bacteroides thetaiotaomicron]|uniref:hypothetical protein n=1 Tax=Bacteroides thetaiotaomicron TaxID=818 RepID=UPI0039C0D556
MKPTTYIDWDGLKDIPFFYCDTKEDEENKDFDIWKIQCKLPPKTKRFCPLVLK